MSILLLAQAATVLEPSGRNNFQGRCPFCGHPDFFVFPDRETWRCFGYCAIGGDRTSLEARLR